MSRVLVVGGGIAGLTAATYLAKAKVEVLLLEQAPRLGGLVAGFWREGFYFDAGIRALENAGILRPMLRELGIDLPMKRSMVSMGLGKRRIALEGKHATEKYLSLLALHFPQDEKTLRKLAETIEEVTAHMAVLYGVDNPLFVEDMDPRYLLKTLLPWLVKYKWSMRKVDQLSMDVREFMASVTDHTELTDTLIQHFFKGIPASFAFSYFYLYQDYLYPEEGTVALIHAMKDRLLELGGRVRTGTEVIAIHPKQSSITLSSGEMLSYDELIWAADMTSMYRAMVPDDVVEKKLDRLNKAKPVESVLSLFLGLDMPSEVLPMSPHHFLTPSTEGISSIGSYDPTWDGEQKIQWLKDYLRLTTYEMSSPSKREEHLAPPDQSSLIISTIIPYEVFSDFRDSGLYEEAKANISEIILETLKEPFMDLKEKVIFCEVSTPLVVEALTHNKNGAISGWASGEDNPVVSSFKDMKKATQTGTSHLYQAGQWTFSPAGLPVSILTGKLAAQEVVKSLKRTKA